jgi:hypothetical protein
MFLSRNDFMGVYFKGYAKNQIKKAIIGYKRVT